MPQKQGRVNSTKCDDLFSCSNYYNMLTFLDILLDILSLYNKIERIIYSFNKLDHYVSLSITLFKSLYPGFLKVKYVEDVFLPIH